MTNEQITAYLLQELKDEEAEQFEEQCFAQEEWPTDLDSTEQELIDAYLRNELSQDRRQRFQKNYLTTDARKARVLTTQSLLHILSQAPTSVRLQGFWQNPFVVTGGLVIILLAAATWWLLAPLLTDLQLSGESHRDIYLSLTSWDSTVGDRSETVTVPLDSDTLIVYLHPPPDRSPDTVSYRIQWDDANGMLDDGNIPVRGFVKVRIPAARLRPGQYVLKLYEIHQDGTEKRVSGAYYFTAKEKTPTQ